MKSYIVRHLLKGVLATVCAAILYLLHRYIDSADEVSPLCALAILPGIAGAFFAFWPTANEGAKFFRSYEKLSKWTEVSDVSSFCIYLSAFLTALVMILFGLFSVGTEIVKHLCGYYVAFLGFPTFFSSVLVAVGCFLIALARAVRNLVAGW